MSLFNQKSFHNRVPVFGLEDEKKYTGTMQITRPKNKNSKRGRKSEVGGMSLYIRSKQNMQK